MSRLLAVDWGSSSPARRPDRRRRPRARGSASAPRGMLTVRARRFRRRVRGTVRRLDAPARQLLPDRGHGRQPAGLGRGALLPLPVGPGRRCAVPSSTSSRAAIAIVPGAQRRARRRARRDARRGGPDPSAPWRCWALADGLFVLPGTHSKWVTVEARPRDAASRTAMTGEFYALLRAALDPRAHAADPSATPLDEAAFRDGVDAARDNGAGPAARRVRRAHAARSSIACRPAALRELPVGARDRRGAAHASRSARPATLVADRRAGADRSAIALRARRPRGNAARTLGAEAAWRGLLGASASLQREPHEGHDVAPLQQILAPPAAAAAGRDPARHRRRTRRPRRRRARRRRLPRCSRCRSTRRSRCDSIALARRSVSAMRWSAPARC